MIKKCLQHINNLKLKHKFALVILTITGLVLFSFDLIVVNYQEKKLIQSLEKNNLSLTQNMATDAVDAILLQDFLALDRLVNSIKQTPLCVYAYILDSHGRVIAHTDKHQLGKIYPITGSQNILVKREGQSSSRILKYFSPIKIGNELLGYGVVGIDRDAVDKAVNSDIRSLRYTLFFASVVLFAVAILFSSFLSNILTKRLSLLKNTMRKVQRGDFNVEVSNESLVPCWEVMSCTHTDCPAYGKLRCWTIPNTLGYYPKGKLETCQRCEVYKSSCGDEVGELTEVFNQMVKDLKSNIQALHKAHLEKCRLERLSLLGQMAAQVAHEIKNPLNAIKGAAHYLRTNFEGELLKEFLGIIEEETDRLSDIVTEFLRFSKPTPPVKVLSNINLLIEDTVDLIKNEVKEKHLRLIIDTDANIRPFKFDYAKMKQALLNLLVNAIEATESGGTIEIKTLYQNSSVSLKVKDSGRGIASENLEHIFKPFFTTKTRGSGLGLAVVEQIVKEHGGEITVKSAVNKGTIFTITLPIEQ